MGVIEFFMELNRTDWNSIPKEIWCEDNENIGYSLQRFVLELLPGGNPPIFDGVRQ